MNRKTLQKVLAFAKDIPLASQLHAAEKPELTQWLAKNPNLFDEVWSRLWINSTTDPRWVSTQSGIYTSLSLVSWDLSASRRLEVIASALWDDPNPYEYRDTLSCFLDATVLSPSELALFVGRSLPRWAEKRLVEHYYDHHDFQKSMFASYGPASKVRAAQWFSTEEFSDDDMAELLITAFANGAAAVQNASLHGYSSLDVFGPTSRILTERSNLVSNRSLRNDPRCDPALTELIQYAKEGKLDGFRTKVNEDTVWGAIPRRLSERSNKPLFPEVTHIIECLGTDENSWNLFLEFMSNPEAMKMPTDQLLSVTKNVIGINA
jgi:hypothetical protein